MRYGIHTFIILLFVSTIVKAQNFSTAEVARFRHQSRQVTIIRDSWGIPHIYGKTDADAVFGLMYAQCEENFSQVEENNLEMLGRLSEKLGTQELYNDLQTKMIYDTSAARNDYARSPEWFKKLLNACADGVNYYLYMHPETRPAVLNRFEPWFALLRTDGSISPTQLGGLTLQDTKTLYPSSNATSWVPALPFYEVDPTGSNGFSIAPSRTRSKNAILYINPHVTFYFRTEVHMVSEEGLNAYGAVTWGNFFVYQGFNEHCGWMHTSSYADVADLFEEKITFRGDSAFYLYDGKMLPAVTRKVSVTYREGNEMKQQMFSAFSTIHGPVLGKRNGHYLSLKENNRSLDALLQSWLRTKANGFTDFKRIMNMRSNNSNNTVFADDKGNIAYWHGNFMPKRNQKLDYGLPVDGTTSSTDWKGIHSLDEVIHVYNPSSGYIQNCNSTPFTVAGKSSPKKNDYPAYMAPDGQNYRAINAARLLEKSHDLTIDRVIKEIGYSHYVSPFEMLLPPLLSAYDALPETDSLHQLGEAIQLLKAWDLNSSISSVASTLAIEWAYRMASKASVAAHPYQQTDAVGQVNSMVNNTTPVQKLVLLSETLRDLEKRFGTWKIAWGEVNRYQRPVDGKFNDTASSLPVGQAAATWGSLPSFATRRFSYTSKRYGVSGNSFIACVEFGKKVKAKTIITGGQSFDPASPHFTDQASMYINGNFKDVWFYKNDVLKHAMRTYHPGE